MPKNDTALFWKPVIRLTGVSFGTKIGPKECNGIRRLLGCPDNNRGCLGLKQEALIKVFLRESGCG